MGRVADCGSEPDDLVRSVSRALRILEVVAHTPGLPVKVIARRAELNLSTTYHLVRTLAFEGYLTRAADGCYGVGREVSRRYHDVDSSILKPSHSFSAIQSLVRVTGLSAYLCGMTGGRMTIAQVVEGPRSPYLEDLEVGLTVAAHASAVGKALLASMVSAHRLEYLKDQGLKPFTSRTITDLPQLETELSHVSVNEPVFDYGEFRQDVSCAAALVPRADKSKQTWALAVSIRSHQFTPGVIVELMRTARRLV